MRFGCKKSFVRTWWVDRLGRTSRVLSDGGPLERTGTDPIPKELLGCRETKGHSVV